MTTFFPTLRFPVSVKEKVANFGSEFRGNKKICCAFGQTCHTREM